MNGKDLDNNRRLLGVSIVIFLSIIITYFIPKFSVYQPTLYSLIYIILTSLVLIIVLYIIKGYMKLGKDSFYKLMGLFVISIIFFTGIFMSTIFINTPDLSNKNLSEISQSNSGFVTEVTYQNDNNTNRSNIILSQDPQPGLLIPKNSSIKLVVSRSEYITINYPSSGENVGKNITVKGKVYNFDNKTQSVYLFVQPQPRGGDGPYIWYLQPIPTKIISVEVNPNGNWKCNAYFGNAGDEGRQFKIVAIVTNGNLTNSYVGYRLPDNLVTSDPIYVNRV